MIKTTLRILSLMSYLALLATAQDSRLGTYHAARYMDGRAQTAREINRLTVTISDREGTSLYTIAKALAYDVGIPAIGVFESGSCVLLDAFHGILEFYDQRGTLVRTVRLFKEALPELERMMPYAVHDHVVSLAVSEPDRPGVRVFRFTEQGEWLFETDLTGRFATGVVLSNSGAVCAVGTAYWDERGLEETTVLLTGDGTIAGSVPFGCFLGAFSENDSLLFVATRRDQALVSVVDRAMVSGSMNEAGSLILDVCPHGNAFYVLAASTPLLEEGLWHYSSPSVVRVDARGVREQVLGQAGHPFTTARLQSVDGTLRLEMDGTFLLIP